ncbi:MAG: hypothetical protein ACI9DF_005708 [Verrucomicrobiales bacterium]|jgi:hypothetical protein
MKSLTFACLALACVGLTSAIAAPSFAAIETDATIVLKYGDLDFLTYHKAEVDPPKEADPIFKRSGFIHPLKNPAGEILTGIHPDDHYHHLGLWHAWVKCKVDGTEVDFWNLKAKTGRVRFGKTLKTVSETDHAGFSVEQEHVAYLDGPDAAPTVILREVFDVTARMEDGAFEIDYNTTQTNVSEHELELPQYRYGGPIAYRAPHSWTESNSDYLGSEGTTRKNGHETRSKWIAFWGPGATSGDPVSLAILGHRENHDFPQRMRVWPASSSNNGAIFFNYAPIQETGWAIKQGETSSMQYRLVAQNGKPEKNALDKRWEHYTSDDTKYWTLASEVIATYKPKLSDRSPASIVEAVKALVSVLSEEERGQLLHPMDSEERRIWTNVPPKGTDGGLRFGDLKREALERACDLLAASLSEQGYLKARNICYADDQLLKSKEQAEKRGGFGTANFWLLTFGEPSATKPWGLQFDGHHIALNLTMAGDKMCYSPAFIGTQPRAIQLGGQEIVVMEKEVSLAFDFVNGLTDAQRKDALKDERRGNLAAGAGQDGVRPDPRGLDLSSLTEAQTAALMKLIHVYVGDLPDKPAEARMKEIAALLGDCRFAWRGPFEPGSDASYHLYGPGLIIEFAGQNLGGDPAEHLHAIYRDPTNEYGAKFVSP